MSSKQNYLEEDLCSGEENLPNQGLITIIPVVRKSCLNEIKMIDLLKYF